MSTEAVAPNVTTPQGDDAPKDPRLDAAWAAVMAAKTPDERAKANADRAALFQSLEPSTEPQPEPTVDELVGRAGVELPELPSQYPWDQQALGDFLSSTQRDGVSKNTTQMILDRLATWGTVGGGFERAITQADAAEWTAWLVEDAKLSQAQARNLVAWYRQQAEGR